MRKRLSPITHLDKYNRPNQQLCASRERPPSREGTPWLPRRIPYAVFRSYLAWPNGWFSANSTMHLDSLSHVYLPSFPSCRVYVSCLLGHMSILLMLSSMLESVLFQHACTGFGWRRSEGRRWSSRKRFEEKISEVGVYACDCLWTSAKTKKGV